MRAIRFLVLVTLLCFSVVSPVSANDLLIRFASLERASVPGILQSPNGDIIDTRAIRRSLYGVNVHPGDTIVWNVKASRAFVHRNSTPTQVLARRFAHLDPAQHVAAVMPGEYWFSVGASLADMDATGAVLFAGRFNRHRLVSSTRNDGGLQHLSDSGRKGLFAASTREAISACAPGDPSNPLPDPPAIDSLLTAFGSPGVLFNYQITATNSPTNFNATGLPPGLSVAFNTGLISGTPTADGVSSVLISAGNSGGTDGETLVISISSPGRVYNPDASGPESLRQRITDASAGDTLSFAPGLDGETIVLDGSPLVIDKDLTIDASTLPNGISISGGDLSRVVSIEGASAVTLNGLTVTGGSVAAGLTGGGGIRVTAGSQLVLVDSTIEGNTSADMGGGIANYGSMNISGSTIAANHAADTGGGVFTAANPVTIENSTISGNTSGLGAGAGINSQAAGGNLLLRHVTVAANIGNTVSGSDPGAGVLSASPAALTIENTLIGDNSAGAGSPSDLGGDVSTVGANLVESHAGTVLGPPVLTSDPALSALGDHGGRTATLIPLAGSPAREAAIVLAATPAADQRGAARPFGPLPDIGAVEVLPLGDAVDLPSLTWATTGDVVWYGQTGVVLDSIDAAQSGGIGDNQSSHVETTVTGPARLTFRWRVSSEPEADYLQFFLDGAELPAAPKISGEVDWLTRTVTIPPGAHTARWSYVKNGSESSGADAGWLDRILYTLLAPEISSALIAYGTLNEPFSYEITATNSPTAFNATGLPAGLGVNTVTGVISGTPTVAGTFSLSVSATNANDTDNENLLLTILTPGEVQNTNSSGPGSMRQLISDAAAGDTVIIDPGLDGETIVLGGLELVIGKDLTIDASALPNGISVAGSGLSRVFAIANNSMVTLKALTITGGAVAAGQFGGGGVLVLAGSHLILNDVTITENTSDDFGGGIANYGTLNVTGSTLYANHAETSGGGVYTQANAVTFENTTVSDNTSGTGSGAGIHNLGAGAALVLRHVTVAGNESNLESGDGPGAGVLSESPAALTLENTLIGDNLTKLGTASDLQGDMTALGANLVENHTGTVLSGPPPLTGDPMLSALGDHGGSTLTRIPLEGSPALNSAEALASTPAFDQRGEARPYGFTDSGYRRSRSDRSRCRDIEIRVRHGLQHARRRYLVRAVRHQL